MKIQQPTSRILAGIGALLLLGRCSADPFPANASAIALQPRQPQPEDKNPSKSQRVLERGPHHAVIETTVRQLGGDGQAVQLPARYVQLETGLNYQDDAGRWQPSVPEIEVVNGRGVFRRGQFKVIFAPRINDPVAVELWTPEGQILKSRILGLAYFDPATGESAMIAETKASVGELLPEKDQILFRDAFTDFHVDVRLKVTKSSFEQDVIFHTQPADPAEWGLGANSELMLLTEFVDPPTPLERTVGAERETGTAHRSSPDRSRLMATNAVEQIEEGATDQPLTFGSLRLGKGRAFGMPAKEHAIPVRKAWRQLDGRQFLIESVPLPALRPEFEKLPPLPAPASAQKRPARSFKEYVQTHPRPVRVADATVSSPLRLAQTAPPAAGVVLDYFAELTSGANVTLQGDTTYLVTGPVVLTGVTSIEGGVVVKYAPNCGAQLKLQGSVRCLTSPYRPAVFTARDDDSVGLKVSGSTGIPTGTYASPAALWIDDNVAPLKHLRISWADTALYYDADTGWPQDLWHAQITHCGYGITALCPEIRVRNALFDQVATNFHSPGSEVTARVEHLTAHTTTALHDASLTLYLTNSLLVEASGTFSGANNVTGSAMDLASAGSAATHYLTAGNSLCNQGTTNINRQLAQDLQHMTTQAPVVLPEGQRVTTNMTLIPWVERDNGLPDIGYHYVPIDYVVNALTVGDGGVLTLAPGTAVAIYGWRGLVADDYGRVSAEGTPTQMIRLLHYPAVMEQTVSWGANPQNYNPTLVCGPQHEMLSNSVSPDLAFRFIQFASQGGFGSSVWTDSGWMATRSLMLQDCQLSGDMNRFSGSSFRPSTIGLLNNLFDRSQVSFFGWAAIEAYNNLFWGGSNNFASYNGGSWTFRDNAFHNTGIAGSASHLTRDHNAYLGSGQQTLAGLFTGDVVRSSFPYTPGCFGGFYQASNDLRGLGSRSAAEAGLFHHTASVDGLKETNSIVDIGFHYVADTVGSHPIVDGVHYSEASKADMSATASTTFQLWPPQRAIDGFSTDPGWHDMTYSGVNEYLQIDLGSDNHQANHLTYVPRVMDASWLNGTWNGVFKRYEIYVSALSAVGNWGAPVASGEWYWPNRQERKEVSFEPKAGRYVTLKRLDAWGWYGPQQGMSNPGYASVGEVWIFEPPSTSPAPVDTDGDGIPDCIEDRNGNGSTTAEAGESDWLHAPASGLRIWITRPRGDSPLP